MAGIHFACSIGAAIFGLGAGFAVLAIGANFLKFPDFSPQFAAMIGIGVGIDYSLLVVTRFREGLHSGASVEDSLARALNTAGRSVIFAGIVVAISFLGLWVMGLPFVGGLGTAGAIVVILSVLVALTLMPALLSLSGHRIDRWRVPFLHAREGVDPTSGWFRLSAAIQRRPLVYFFASAAILLFLAIPLLRMDLGFTDAGNQPENYHSWQAYDLLAEGFGPGFNAPLIVVADLTSVPVAEREKTVAEASRQLAAAPEVVEVVPAQLNPAGDTAVLTVLPGTKPPGRAHQRRRTHASRRCRARDRRCKRGHGAAVRHRGRRRHRR
ncbi:MAG: MMPL family transporter [Tepidiformaceae bacterium]